jgi:hypothetical protein
MSESSESGRPGDSAAVPGPRRAWTAPRMQRISLQRTLAGSSDASDVIKETSAIPT